MASFEIAVLTWSATLFRRIYIPLHFSILLLAERV